MKKLLYIFLFCAFSNLSLADNNHQRKIDLLFNQLKSAIDFEKSKEIEAKIWELWTSQVAQKELSQWLSTNTKKVDGIAVQSSGETGTLQALLQSGLDPIPPIALGGELGALCYWRQNPGYIDEAIYAWPPGDEIELGMDVMIRTLQGQSPMIQSILVGPATKNFDEISEILNEDCDRNSTGWDNPGMDKWAPKEYVEAFFENPSDPTKYDPKSH